MADLIILFLNAIASVCRVVRPGGIRSVVAESVLLKHQLLILNRPRLRAPNLRTWDRAVVGLCSVFVKPARLARVAIALKPSTILNFHQALVRRKYRLLFSPKRRTKPGPKGPDAEITRAVVEMKQPNPTWACLRIANQINLAFGTCINKDVVRRILAQHYQPTPNGGPPFIERLIGRFVANVWTDCCSGRRRIWN